MADPIAIVSVGDEGAVRAMQVMAINLLACAEASRPINYHVVYCGSWTRDLDLLINCSAGPLQVHVHHVRNPYEDLGPLRHLSTATFLRFDVPNIFSHLARVIYLDVDMLIMRDISALFDEDLEGQPIGAVVDAGLMLRRNSGWNSVNTDDFVGNTEDYLIRLMPEISPREFDRYVNGGLQVMNIASMIEMNYPEKTKSFVSERNTRLLFRDQDTLNHLFFDHIYRIDPRWNVQTSSIMRPLDQYKIGFQRDTIELQREDPWIVHFTGKAKPWNSIYPNPYAKRWRWFAQFAPSGAAILEEWRLVQDADGGDADTALPAREAEQVREKLGKFGFTPTI